jgi:hypothetical protein
MEDAAWHHIEARAREKSLRGICQSVGVNQTKLLEMRSSFRGGPGHEGPKEGSLFDSVIARNPEDQWRRWIKRHGVRGEKAGNLDMSGQAQDLVARTVQDTPPFYWSTSAVRGRKTQCLS